MLTADLREQQPYFQHTLLQLSGTKGNFEVTTIVSIRMAIGAYVIAGAIGLTSLAGGAASADGPWTYPANTKYTPVKLQPAAAPASNQITAGPQGTAVTGGPIVFEPIVVCDKMGCHEFPGPQ